MLLKIVAGMESEGFRKETGMVFEFTLGVIFALYQPTSDYQRFAEFFIDTEVMRIF